MQNVTSTIQREKLLECRVYDKSFAITFGGFLSHRPPAPPSSPLNYKDSGVDVETGDQFVDWIQSDTAQSAHKDRIISGVGGFASLFRIDFPEMKKPCLITCTDGVGTKVLLASFFESYESVGQDLVAMCVNDLVTTGGKPLMFLDYYATSKLDLKAAQEFLSSVKKACIESECALVGGETAEMPGVYKEKDFDCAGFAVGVVDQEECWSQDKVCENDILIGLSSNGFHSNGYSLIRKVFAKDLDQWRETLLKPTHLYVKVCLALKNASIHAAAHITGGGMQNIPRVVPDGLCVKLKSWAWPEEFLEVQRRTQMTALEMLETLNCGIGFVFIAPESSRQEIEKKSQDLGFLTYDLGCIEKAKTPLEKNQKLIYEGLI